MAYRVKEAAKEIGLSRTKMYEVLNRGEIPYFKVDSVRLISRRALEEWIAKKEGLCG